MRRAALVAGALVAVAALAPPAAAAARQPVPVYAVKVADATSAAGTVPPPNPPAGAEAAVDSYTADVYERPYAGGPGGTSVLPDVDITSARAGAGAEHLHYRMDLAGVDPGTGRLSHSYAFELDFDDDPAGDLLVRVDGTGTTLATSFAATGVTAFWNRNSNVTGPTAHFPDGPGATPDGYEEVVFDAGANRLPGAQGGGDAVTARLAPERPASLEVAVAADFLQEMNDDLPVNKVSFRASASAAVIDHGAYYLHDRFGRAEAGSPYPFLRTAGAPSACPERDADLSAEQRAALDSGTGNDTGRANPCHPAAAVAAYDNAVFATAAPGSQPVPGQAGPDLSVEVSSEGRLAPGRQATLLVTVRNEGNGATTGPTTVHLPLPPGIRLLSAGGRGWSCLTAGRDVRCRRPAAIGAGRGAQPVALELAAGPGLAEGATLAARVSGAGDASAANDSAVHRVEPDVPGGGRSRSTPILFGLGTVFLGSLALWLRLDRVRTAGTPSSSPSEHAGRRRRPGRSR